jgi:hypothetical protein
VRTPAERADDVRALLRAADAVHARRGALAPDLVAATGLSREGVELGFESLERGATDDDLLRLVAAAGDARHVHVVLSANVFVAALRALALAVAAAPRVTVRPSPRDPVVARALVEACGGRAGGALVAITEERDAGAVGADAVHVYGRDSTVAAVRARVGAETAVVGHGAGLGVAYLTRAAALDRSAAALARDVAAFDQRGCLSARVAIVEGDAARAHDFAAALHEHLTDLDVRVPRGGLADDERAEAVRWREALAFAGRVYAGAGHAIGVPDRPDLALPPPGRHVHVVAAAGLEAARALLAPIAGAVVTVGTDAPTPGADVAPAHARVAKLGRMQRPPLDGPVDRRTVPSAAPSR